jgi:hypothetical protein
MCYLVILSVELCLGKLWEFPTSYAQNYFNYRKNARVLGIPIGLVRFCALNKFNFEPPATIKFCNCVGILNGVDRA